MSHKSSSTKIEPMRTRKSSKKEKNKGTSGDIKEAFKMAIERESFNEQLNREATTSVKELLSVTQEGSDNEVFEDEIVATEEKGVQVTPIDLEIDEHDNQEAAFKEVGVSIDSSKEEILEAMQELTEKFTKLDDIINHPKKGIGAQVCNLVLKGDNLHTSIHSASDGILKNIADMQSDIDVTKKSMEHVEQGQSRLTTMLAENKRLSRDLVTTQGLLQKYSQKIQNLEARILDLTRRGMEQNLVFHAIEEAPDPKRENCIDTLVYFVKEHLQVDIQDTDIWKCYRMGAPQTNKSRPIFAKLAYTAKDAIMEKVGMLKDKRNTHSQVRFISEQIPEGISEMKKAVGKRAAVLRKAEEKKPPSQRQEIKIIADKILVGGQVDKLEVCTPQPFELFPGMEEQKAIDGISRQIHETRPIFFRNSTFVGLAVEVHSLEEINNAYKAVMQRFPFMDHVPMAYCYKTEDRIKVGSCDDMEHGAGSCISAFLYQNRIKNAAVFVVRRYGGIHLGYDRFRVIENSAKEAVKLLRPDLFPDPDATSSKKLPGKA